MSDTEFANYINLGLLIITFTSTFAPVIVTIINNIHDTNVKRLESNNKFKHEILSNFSLSVTKNFSNHFVNNDFHRDLNLLYIYFNVDNNLINRIMTHKYKDIYDFQNDVTKLMIKLSKQIKCK